MRQRRERGAQPARDADRGTRSDRALCRQLERVEQHAGAADPARRTTMTLTRRPLLSLTLTAFLATPFTIFAQTQHAPVHGQVKLDVAIDGPTVLIELDRPLHHVVGSQR